MDGLVCIVTGANSLTGIGRASVLAFAKKNAKVIYATDINDDNLASLAEEVTSTTGVECIPKRVDASSDDDIQAVINDALDKYGRLDVFFANAGVARRQPMATETQETFLDIMRINTWSVYAAIKYAPEAMQKTSTEKPIGGGSIIATASIAGVRAGAGPVGYSASKAAVINLVQSSSYRLQGKNIRVNAVCPGLIETEMTSKLLAVINDNETLTNTVKHVIALEKPGKNSDIANMVAFLAGPESSYITGQDIKVDGGITATFRYIPGFADN